METNGTVTISLEYYNNLIEFEKIAKSKDNVVFMTDSFYFLRVVNPSEADIKYKEEIEWLKNLIRIERNENYKLKSEIENMKSKKRSFASFLFNRYRYDT